MGVLTLVVLCHYAAAFLFGCFVAILASAFG
jgi:hypothetical protein